MPSRPPARSSPPSPARNWRSPVEPRGELVDLIQSARTSADALIINPAAYSFTSIAIFDAMKIFDGPIYEVHISNIHARDELHRHSKLQLP